MMEKKEIKKTGAAAIQVFELTMDNTEDQDELNRRLRKPGESNCSPPDDIGSSTSCQPIDSNAAGAAESRKNKSQ
jgi:hypothetical protein